MTIPIPWVDRFDSAVASYERAKHSHAALREKLLDRTQGVSPKDVSDVEGGMDRARDVAIMYGIGAILEELRNTRITR